MQAASGAEDSDDSSGPEDGQIALKGQPPEADEEKADGESPESGHLLAVGADTAVSFGTLHGILKPLQGFGYDKIKFLGRDVDRLDAPLRKEGTPARGSVAINVTITDGRRPTVRGGGSSPKVPVVAVGPRGFSLQDGDDTVSPVGGCPDGAPRFAGPIAKPTSQGWPPESSNCAAPATGAPLTPNSRPCWMSTTERGCTKL